MICRVALHEKPPGSVASDEARSFREWLKELPVFVSGYHVQDSKTGRMLSITIWDSEERLTEHEDRTPSGGSLGIQTKRLELFPVLRSSSSLFATTRNFGSKFVILSQTRILVQGQLEA